MTTLKKILRQYSPLLVVMWLGNIAIGLGASILGPSLPYLSLRANETLKRLGLIITARSVAFCFSSFCTGFIFCRIRRSEFKLVFLAFGVFLMAVFMLIVPFARSFSLLIIALAGFGLGSGIYDTASNTLAVYTFGPEHSRPLLQFLHFGVSLGGFLTPVISRPFLIAMGPIGGTSAYCKSFTGGADNATSNMSLVDISSSILSPVPPLVWPFVIMASNNMIGVIGLCLLALFGTKVTEYIVSEQQTSKANEIGDKQIEAKTETKQTELQFRPLIFVLVFIFYFLFCGTENMFWSYIHSFGICSKLQLDEADASTLNTIFFAGFLSGRGTGVFVARFVPPAILIVVQLLSCVISAGIISLWGETSMVLTFVFVGIFGYSISMIFGCGISWMASVTSITGSVASIWFIGAYVGISTFPAVAGVLFATKAGAISMMYLSVGTCSGSLMIFGIMSFLARYRIQLDNCESNEKETVNVEKTDLSQD